MNIGASLKVHNLVNLDDQREDLVSSPSLWTAGRGLRRPLGLVASSAFRKTHRGGLDRAGA